MLKRKGRFGLALGGGKFLACVMTSPWRPGCATPVWLRIAGTPSGAVALGIHEGDGGGRLSGLLDLAAADAGGANIDALWSAIDDRTDPL